MRATVYLSPDVHVACTLAGVELWSPHGGTIILSVPEDAGGWTVLARIRDAITTTLAREGWVSPELDSTDFAAGYAAGLAAARCGCDEGGEGR